jgi:hypothetical protein
MKNLLITASILLFINNLAASVEKSPFTDVTFESSPSVTVTYEGDTYFLLAINDMKREEVINECHNQFAADCEEKFSVNFLETMKAIGVTVENDTVKLKLYKFAQHKIVTVKEALLLEENVEDIIFNRELRGE